MCHRYTFYELRNQLEKSGSTLVVSHVSCLEVTKSAIKGLGVKQVIVLTDPDLPTPAFVGFDCPSVVTLEDLISSSSSSSSSSTMIESTPSAVLSRVAPTDVALLPYSSGTTGLPKGTMLSHANLTVNLSQLHSAENVNLSPHATVFSPLPFFHIYGLCCGALAQAQLHNTLVTMRSFDLCRFLELCDEHRPERAHLVPPIILGLTKHPAVDDYDLSHLQMVLSAAAPLGREVVEALKKRTGVRCKQLW